MGQKRRRDELDPAAVLAGKAHVDAPGLLRLIHRVNPTGLELPARERVERYAMKSRLQSLLIRRFADSLTVVPDPNDEAIVSIRRRAFDDDACHAVIADLDEDGRRWVRDQLDVPDAEADSPAALTRKRRATVEAAAPSDLDECSVPALLEIGERATAAYDYELARDALERALDRSQGNVAAARALLALLVDHLGVDQDALDLQPRLSREALAESEVVLSLALAAARIGDEALARSLLATQRADGLAERVNDVLFALADRAISTNAVGDARRAIDEAAARHPGDPRIADRLATLERMARDARRPREEALRQALAREEWDEAGRLADEMLAAWPDSELARKAVRSLAERRAEEEADGLEAEAARRRDAGDAATEASLLRSIVALRSPGSARDGAVRRLAEVEAEQAAGEASARVAATSACLRDDLCAGLARYVAESAEVRERVRDASRGIRELEWLDRMRAARIPNDEALRAASALGEAIDAVSDTPEAAMDWLGPHLKALRSVPDASRVIRDAEQRVAARGAAERDAIVARAEALLERGDAGAAASALDELEGSGAPASERRTAARLREKIARAAAEAKRDATYARALQEGDPFTAHAFAAETADAADDATRPKWQRVREEAWNELRRALQIRIWRPAPEAASPASDRIEVGRIVELAEVTSESAHVWVDASGRWLALLENHDRYLFVRAVDLESRRLRWRLTLRAPVRFGHGDVWHSTRGTLVIVGAQGALLELSEDGDVVGWRSGLGTSDGEVLERVAYTPDLRFLWAEVRTVGPNWRSVMRVIDLAHGLVVRELPSSWMVRPLNGQPEPTMVTALDDGACVLHASRGAIRQTIELGDNRTLDVHPHPSGLGLLLLVGAPEDDDDQASPLAWVEVDARGKPSAPTWIEDSESMRPSAAAVALADGLAFVKYWAEDGGGHLVGYRCEAGRAVAIWSIAIPEGVQLRLVTDPTSRAVGALLVGDEHVHYMRLGQEPPSLPFVESTPAPIPAADYTAAFCGVSQPIDEAMSTLWDKVRKMSDDAHVAELEAGGGLLAVEELVERHVAAVASYKDRAAAALGALLGTRAKHDARFALSAAELHARGKRWADARTCLTEVDLGTLEPEHRCHAHHLLALAELHLDEAPAALRALSEAARDNGQCELAPLVDLATPLTAESGASGGGVVALRRIIDATDTAFADADLERARAIDHAMVWRSDEVQALARLAELHLRRAPQSDDDVYTSTLALAKFLEAHRDRFRRDLPLPGARWRHDRLDDIAARAERWLADPPLPPPSA